MESGGIQNNYIVHGGVWSMCVPLLATLPPLTAAQLTTMCVGMALIVMCTALMHWSAPGGNAWGRLRRRCRLSIPGPRGWPVVGHLFDMNSQLAHVRLANLASSCSARTLMAFSLGNTPAILTCVPDVAKEILSSSAFADRPIKQAARDLLFHRAIGFAPYGAYWRNLRRIAATYLFSPRRIQAHDPLRQRHADCLISAIGAVSPSSATHLRSLLQQASMNNIMGSVFGKTYNFSGSDAEAVKLQGMVREGFELLGAVNWADHLPFFDTNGFQKRCSALVGEVKGFVQKIIDEHRAKRVAGGSDAAPASVNDGDFVDVLLNLADEGDQKLSDDDMIAVLWEMIFRGTDTTAILTEWVMAEMVLHPEIQQKVQKELDGVVSEMGELKEATLAKLPYLNAVIKETLRMHPPGPLLSWARLAVHDVEVAGHLVPAGTTAMVNMWAITHDEAVWKDAGLFKPERFVPEMGGEDVDIRGGDLRLAPFGAGRRVCPGRALGHATVQLWVARLLHAYTWSAHPAHPVDLTENLKLSCEMRSPLLACAVPRFSGAAC